MTAATNNIPPPAGIVERAGPDCEPYLWQVRFPTAGRHRGGDIILIASREGAEALAIPVPDPVPDGLLRALIEGAEISQGEAARALHVLPQTLRKWLAAGGALSKRETPWASAELLRRLLIAGEIGRDAEDD